MTEVMVKITDLKKEYRLYSNPADRVKEVLSFSGRKYSRAFKALDGISMEVKKGETVGIIGANGAGKSTLLKIITGVLPPTSGQVEVHGKIAALLELGAGFNQEYTGMQNIYLNGRIMGFSKKQMDERVKNIVDFADIGEFIDQPVKTYSSGMFARLAFAVAINVEPDILIVDEALSVGDVFFQNKCFRKFEELKNHGVTILFVSHDIESVRQMCSRILWIDHGMQKLFGPSAEVCDLYMDEKRKSMNEGIVLTASERDTIKAAGAGASAVFPPLHYKESKLTSKRFQFLSCFITDSSGAVTTDMRVEQEYQFHMVIDFFEDMDCLIAGFVFENKKGLPIYDINNFINQGQTWRGVKGQISEIIFKYRLPRVMKGTYAVSATLAQGSQQKHLMLTWLHGVLEATVINDGYNSSYIEIPSEITVQQYEKEQVRVLEG